MADKGGRLGSNEVQKMKLLMNIKILGINYPVKFGDLEKQAGNDNAGSMNTTQCLIFISDVVNSELHMRSALLHEVAPFAGAWIETVRINELRVILKSRALRGRVD